MSEIKNNLEECVKEIIVTAIQQIKSNEIITLSDLYIDLNFDDLTLSVFDDDESLLSQGSVDGLNVFKEEPDTFDSNVIAVLKSAVHSHEVMSELESLDVIKPFSVILVGEDFDQKTELLRLDDDMIVIEDEYLKNIDKELDEFLKHLLSDI